MEKLPENLKEYKISEIENIHILGRNVPNAVKCGSPVSLKWAASGLELNVKTREIWALIETDYDSLEIWLCVLINGRIVSRFMSEKGKQWICLARGFSGENAFKICLMRDSQAMFEDRKQSVKIHSFAVSKIAAAPNSADGLENVFLPLPKRDLKIEFIGDSITSGEGMIGSASSDGGIENEWVSTWISPSKNYAVQASQKLNADFSLISQCGWGIVTSWDNNKNNIVPPLYEKVLFESEKWQADFVFVNLGTNDSSGFSKVDWQGADEICDGVKSFLKVIRNANPSAKICWIWGMIDVPLVVPYLEKGVKMYIDESGDKNIFTMVLPSMADEKTDDDKGSRGHPGPLTHKKAAEKIIDFVNTKK